MNNINTPFSLILFAFIALIALGCHDKAQPVIADGKVVLSSELKRDMKKDTAKLSQVNSDLTLFAKVTADQDQLSPIYPLASGIVLRISGMLGDHVTAGQELAVLRSSDVNDFQNQYNQAQNNVRLAEKNATIAEELYKTNVYSERDLLSARNELKKAQSDLERVKQLFTIYGAKIDNGVPEYKVTSPVDGYIIAKNITPNMAVRTDNGTSLFTISPLKTVWILADVYENDVAKVRLGQVVDIITVAYPDSTFKGTIQQVSSIIDPLSKTLKIRIVLENSRGLLKPEMFAHVKVKFSEQKQMIRISSDAVIFESNKHFVMVYYSDDHIETKEISIYKENNGATYIARGLNVGDIVIAKYAQLIYRAFNSKN